MILHRMYSCKLRDARHIGEFDKLSSKTQDTAMSQTSTFPPLHMIDADCGWCCSIDGKLSLAEVAKA